MESFDLELHMREGRAGLEVNFRLRYPDGGHVELAVGAPLTLDLAGLTAARLDTQRYGELLGDALLGAPEAARAWTRATSAAAGAGADLRVRLRIDRSAEELQGLRWETLWLPGELGPLALRERTRLSRYLDAEQRPASPAQAAHEVRAALLVAHPDDLARYGLDEFDAAGEAARARGALGAIPSELWCRAAGAAPATVGALRQALRGGASVLYLVAHGKRAGDEHYIFMEDEGGASAQLSGAELARLLAEVGRAPALAVLAPCGGAGEGDGDGAAALAAVGPQLVRAGAGAVVAMQGPAAVASEARFSAELFRELGRDGVIDRAVAAARATLRDSKDWWVPALFMRLADGRLWRAGPSAADLAGLGAVLELPPEPEGRGLLAGDRARLLRRRSRLAEAHGEALRRLIRLAERAGGEPGREEELRRAAEDTARVAAEVAAIDGQLG